MTDISVATTGTNDTGWTFKVTVADGRASAHFTVSLTRQDYEALSGSPAAVTPERLIEESFVFLLEREPVSSILRSFSIPTITRYFPEYPKEIARRLKSR